MDMVNQDINDDKVRIGILTENTAQGVLNNLKALMSNQAHMRTRWVWELLQNARDARADVVSVKHDEDKVVFRHNGDSFTMEEIGHLVYHGSTKTEDAGTIGQYGSGFLTTHLLSPEIRVSGRLKDARRFRFRLRRELGSVSDLTNSMEQAWQDFLDSRNRSPASDDSGTEFIYPLDNNSRDAVDAVDKGIAMLKRCAPFAVVFNDEFSSIRIESRGETTAFKAARRSPLANKRGLHEVVVWETANGIRRELRYVVAQGANADVAIPLKSNDGDTACAPILEIPKLFLGFPLIGTEDFGFPAVVNSLKFTPTENRDGVYLGQSGDKANVQNQKIIEEACGLLADLIEFAAESGWRDICELARVPQIVHRDWLNASWLKTVTDRLLVEKIRGTAIVLNGAGERIRPDALKLPFADTGEGALALWDLLADWNGYKEILPRQDEAAGWRDAVESWARIANHSVSSYPEIVDGGGLAKIVHNASLDPSVTPTTHRVSRLGLKEGVDAIDWLNRLIAFLMGNGLLDSVHSYRIVPSQAGFLRVLRNLHRDTGIDEELKSIADLTNEWRVRPRLRDTRVVSLDDETGAGDWGNGDVVRSLIRDIKAREKNPDEICFQASARLFAWIARRRDWSALRDLPIFSAEYESENRQTSPLPLKLDNSPSQEDLLPLAPVASWAEDLQPYSVLFPKGHTLADFYFEAVPDEEIWDELDRMDFVRKSVIIARKARHRRFLPDELSDDEAHETKLSVSVTDIAFISRRDVGITERVRRSRPLARTFWRFLTEWAVKHDSAGLEIGDAPCDCGETHRYYPAEWLIPVSDNKWVPSSARGSGSARQTTATAESLAELLRGSGWTLNSLDHNPGIVKLLEAIGVTQFDLTLSFMAETAEERNKRERDLTKILASTGGNLDPVNEFVEDLEDDPKLLAHLAERRERRRIVYGNQLLGEQVENLVKQSLESEGFTVSRTGIGSDFEIELDDAASLNLARGGKNWLIEVKATRDQSVRMTHRQAETAVEEGDGFLLCVVPIDGAKPDPELEDVRASMRFVSDIGARLDEPMQRLREFRIAGGIAAYSSDGVQLEVESGAARVANSVWENDGFPLDALRDNLK